MSDAGDLASEIRRRRDVREQCLVEIYRSSGGVAGELGQIGISFIDIPGATETDVEEAVDLLEQKGLLETYGPDVFLTSFGVEHVEQLVAPADSDVLHVLNAIELRQVESFTTRAQNVIESGQVEGDQETLDEILETLRFVQGQLGKKPRRRLVASCLQVVRGLAVGIGAGAIVEMVPTLVG